MIQVRSPSSYPSPELTWWKPYFDYVYESKMPSVASAAKTVFLIIKQNRREMAGYLKWISDPSHIPTSVDLVICRLINEAKYEQ